MHYDAYVDYYSMNMSSSIAYYYIDSYRDVRYNTMFENP